MSGIRCFWLERTAEGLLRRADTGELFEHPHLAGVGAIYDAPWLRARASDFWPPSCEPKSYEDGLTIVVVTPGGPWVVDGPAYDGAAHKPCPWTRTGDPRRPDTLTVTPSINQIGSYHGWLRAGHLVPA